MELTVFSSLAGLAAGLPPVLLAPAALALDAVLGEPPARFHPVCAMGALARRVELFWRGHVGPGVTPPQARGWRLPGGLCTAGALAACTVSLPFAAAGALLALLAGALAGEGAAWLCAALAAYLCLAPCSLGEHALRVAEPLRRSAGCPVGEGEAGLEEARRSVSMLVGRDTAALDAPGVARACIESVGENLTDGVLSTLFWAAAGGLAAGAAGAAGAVLLHRACNVLDALWGKRDEAYARFGTCAARADDALNWFPARLSLPLIALAALLFPACSGREALRMGWRYRRAHASPNSAWSEAAFAGALGLRLGGPVAYRGRAVDYPWLGEGRAEAGAGDIARAVRLMWASSLLAGGFAALLFWAV